MACRTRATDKSNRQEQQTRATDKSNRQEQQTESPDGGWFSDQPGVTAGAGLVFRRSPNLAICLAGLVGAIVTLLLARRTLT
jgi:hypothetical protein